MYAMISYLKDGRPRNKNIRHARRQKQTATQCDSGIKSLSRFMTNIDGFISVDV